MNQPLRRSKSKALKCRENSSRWYSSDQTNAGSCSKKLIRLKSLVLDGVPCVTYEMQPFNCVSSIFTHQHWLIVFGIPWNGLVDNSSGDHIQSAWVRVPAIVAVEGDDVQMFSLKCPERQRQPSKWPHEWAYGFVVVMRNGNGSGHRTLWIEQSCVIGHRTKVGVGVNLLGPWFVCDRPHHNTGMIAISMNQLFERWFVLFQKGRRVVSAEKNDVNWSFLVSSWPKDDTHSASTLGHSSIIMMPCSSANCIDSSE